jgi:hypothetical protein
MLPTKGKAPHLGVAHRNNENTNNNNTTTDKGTLDDKETFLSLLRVPAYQ